MEIQSQYRALGPRLEMIRRTMPKLSHDQLIEIWRDLGTALGDEGHKLVPPGDFFATLAGFKPAATCNLPVSPAAQKIEAHINELGFKFTGQVKGTSLAIGQETFPLRWGIFWSVATACEMFGQTEPQISEDIKKYLALPTYEEQMNKLPVYLLGYADNGNGRAPYQVSVNIVSKGMNQFRFHYSRASEKDEAVMLAKHYSQAANLYNNIILWNFFGREFSVEVSVVLELTGQVGMLKK